MTDFMLKLKTPKVTLQKLFTIVSNNSMTQYIKLSFRESLLTEALPTEIIRKSDLESLLPEVASPRGRYSQGAMVVC